MNNNKKIKRLFLVLECLLAMGIIIHAFFYFFTGSYLITSGVMLYILISLFVYFVFLLFERIFKMKLKIGELQLVLFSITICLCLTEIVFILSGYKATYLEKRNHFYYTSEYHFNENNRFHTWPADHDLKTDEYCYHRRINSERLSDREHTIFKAPNEFRIIGIGDSFTEGDGADFDSTWLKFLERSLAKYPLKKQLTFFNSGVCGSDPYFEYMLLKERLLKYKPDLVLLTMNNSDICDVLLRGGFERFRPDGTLKYNTPPWWEPLYAMSHISRLFFSAFGYNEFLYKKNQSNTININRKINEIIDDFDKLASANGFKFVVIFHPFKSEIILNKMELDDVYNKTLQKGTTETLNLLDYFIKVEKINSLNCGQYYWEKDGHHNAKGYEVFARGVEWKLKEMGIIDTLTLENY